MREPCRRQRGLACERTVDIERNPTCDLSLIVSGDLHEQIVRMLAIDQRLPAGVAGLAEQRIRSYRA